MNLLTQVLIRDRHTTITDDYGDTVTTTESLNIYGRLRTLSASERFNGDTPITESTHRLYCTPCDIKLNDTIRSGDNTYKVIFIDNVMSMDRLWQVDLQCQQ